MHSNIIPGLYRWIFPGKLPNAIKVDSLKDEDGQLVLPDVSEFCVEVPAGSNKEDNRKTYSGPLPAGIYIRIRRGERNMTAYAPAGLQNNDDDNRNDEIKSVIVFP